MENPLALELFRLEIKHAVSILKEVSSLACPSWIQCAKTLIDRIDISKCYLEFVTNELESLALTLMWRFSSKLSSIKPDDDVPHVMELMKRLKDIRLSSLVKDGINEFLMTHDAQAPENKADFDLFLLKKQLECFQKTLNNLTELKPSQDMPNVESCKSEETSGLEAGAPVNMSSKMEPEEEIILPVQNDLSYCILDLNGNFCKN